MKSAKFLRLTVIYMFCGSMLLAQDPLDFFPHHLGDLWEYWLDAGPGGYIISQNQISRDSLGNNGMYHIETTSFGEFILDTTSFEVYSSVYISYGSYGKVYRLDADSGDSWIVIQDSSGDYAFIAVVSEVYQDLLFGQFVTIKVIDYYWHILATAESLWTQTHYLASNFGMVRRDIEFSSPEYLIKGAIIDSVLYGTVTSVEPVEKTEVPNSFELHQNYPNPFNPTTTIKYELPVAAEVELSIYDLIGRHVSTPVNSRQAAGTYYMRFDGHALSSGVYVYRLKIDRAVVLARKMVLLK